jgi:adenine phosphoribosyltransferase
MGTIITVKDVENSIRNIPDFPQKGIQFKDITTALKNPDIFSFVADELFKQYEGKGITKVVGIESRGFIMASILAYKLKAGFIPIRKPGKLPAPTFSKSYSLEYGLNTLHIHQDALDKDDVVLLHDDLLATGGSASAAVELINKFDVRNIYISFICELGFLKGREILGNENNIQTLIKY